MKGISSKAISLKLPEELLAASTRVAEALGITRTEYIRNAIEDANRRMTARERATRLADASRRVRDESMRVNAEFAAFEHDPDA